MLHSFGIHFSKPDTTNCPPSTNHTRCFPCPVQPTANRHTEVGWLNSWALSTRDPEPGLYRCYWGSNLYRSHWMRHLISNHNVTQAAIRKLLHHHRHHCNCAMQLNMSHCCLIHNRMKCTLGHLIVGTMLVWWECRQTSNYLEVKKPFTYLQRSMKLPCCNLKHIRNWVSLFTPL